MWKKEEGMANPQSQPGTAPQNESPKRSVSPPERATIGRSITISGDVGGDEDLLIQGQVDGSVNLDLHSVTVGSEGRVKANISGRVVVVEGRVEGDLNAKEQIILRSSAHVMGDISAPRVVLEDGASFRGLVDMGAPAEHAKPAGESSATQAGSDEKSAASSGSTGTAGNSGTKSSQAMPAKGKSPPDTVGKVTP
jgi:cytoskeletal protein CcmA (bactofilin family)